MAYRPRTTTGWLANQFGVSKTTVRDAFIVGLAGIALVAVLLFALR